MERARPTAREYQPKTRNRNRAAAGPSTGRPGSAFQVTLQVRGTQATARRAPRARTTLIGGLALTSAVLLSGCDSVSGIPDDNAPSATAHSTTPSAAVPSTPPPATSALPPVPADAPAVGAVPGLPAAVAAVQRWAADLQSGATAELRAKCWSIAPRNVTAMYADQQSILTALAQPGTLTQDTVTWKNRGTTVAVDRAAVDTGYACPRVATAGADIAYDDADARHTVRRYLARFVGSPLDPADKEEAYPLVCKPSPATWDPKGTGRPVRAPLAGDQGMLTGTTKFADQEISSEQLRGDYLAVLVPVTNSSGVTQTRTFTLQAGPDGYCIGDVSS